MDVDWGMWWSGVMVGAGVALIFVGMLLVLI